MTEKELLETLYDKEYASTVLRLASGHYKVYVWKEGSEVKSAVFPTLKESFTAVPFEPPVEPHLREARCPVCNKINHFKIVDNAVYVPVKTCEHFCNFTTGGVIFYSV